MVRSSVRLSLPIGAVWSTRHFWILQASKGSYLAIETRMSLSLEKRITLDRWEQPLLSLNGFTVQNKMQLSTKQGKN